MKCPTCDGEVARHKSRCPHCDANLGFPNVRAAEEPAELAALLVRYDQAHADARTRSTSAVLTLFEEEVKTKSRGIITRGLGTVNRLIDSGNGLFQTFYKQVDLGRVPEDNEWDPHRPSVEGRLFPFYHDQIHFAALSLSEFGAAGYGGNSPCVFLLKNTIQPRASVFEENCVVYAKHTKQPAALPFPPGLRATWADRHRLAVAKLGSQLTPTTTPADFPGILVVPGTQTGDEKIVEIHIHNPLTEQAVEKARLPKVKPGLTKLQTKVENTLLKDVRRKLEALRVKCEVV